MPVSTYGSGIVVIPSTVSPTSSTADIISYVPSSVNGLGYQDHNRGGTTLYKQNLAVGASAYEEIANLPLNIRGFILDINALSDGQSSTSGIEIFSFYSTTNGASYSSPELIATVSGRVIQSRVYVEYRASNITNAQFIFTNIDPTYPCKSLNITATLYR